MPTSSFTVTGVNGSLALTVTNDSYGLSLASSFAATTGADVYSSAGAYTAGAGGVAIGSNLGFAAVTASGSTVLGGDGTSLFVSASGSNEIIAGSGNDSVIALSGSDTIALGDGNNFIQLGSGTAFADTRMIRRSPP